MGYIDSINISEKKGTKKIPIENACLKVDHGIIGDAHAGPGIRQVSLLSKESITDFSLNPKLKICLHNGSFGENITTRGIDLESLKLGDKLMVGNSLVEISKIGKECHKPCQIFHSVGDCIMPKKGIFAKVIINGNITTGDIIKFVKN